MKHIEIAELLIQHGAKINELVLENSILNKNKELIELSLKHLGKATKNAVCNAAQNNDK